MQFLEVSSYAVLSCQSRVSEANVTLVTRTALIHRIFWLPHAYAITDQPAKTLQHHFDVALPLKHSVPNPKAS